MEKNCQKISNKMDLEYGNQENDACRETIMDEIEHRRLKWSGHLRRMKDGRIPKAVHTWKIERRNRKVRLRANVGL